MERPNADRSLCRPAAKPDRRRRLRRLLASAAGLLLIGPSALLLAAFVVQDPDQGPGGELRALLDKWVETQRIISQEKRDWALGKELMRTRIDAVQREIATLRERIAADEAEIAKIDAAEAELFTENARLQEASAAMVDVVGQLEARTQRLLARLPEPIVDKVRTFSQRLPADPANTDVRCGERFAAVVAILNEIDKFDQTVTLLPEQHELSDGRTVEAATIYVGLGQAYFATADGRFGGIGSAGTEGYVWQSADEAAKDISRAIGILENREPAAFVRLPVRIR
ncbi:MAG: DUF3450 family protein [Planctomycetes bacterium]|nr:DUF3450 family protein [Planctomycetota bacterium]